MFDLYTLTTEFTPAQLEELRGLVHREREAHPQNDVRGLRLHNMRRKLDEYCAALPPAARTGTHG